MGVISKEDSWAPLERPDCECLEHVEDLADLIIPNRDWDEDPTLAQLLETGSLGVADLAAKDRFMTSFDEDDNESVAGPMHWVMWAADEIYGCYEDKAVLPFDQSIAARPGVDLVIWYDREEFLIGAPRLCQSGLLAAIARALEDPRVRQLPS